MMLHDGAIYDLAVTQQMISPFSMEYLQPCSYDVRLDGQIMRYHVDNFSKDRTPKIDAMSRRINNMHLETIDFDDEFELFPGEFILGTTIERVKIPYNIACRFEGKSSLGRMGLTTHVTAGFIDPGFSGQITLEIVNMHQAPISIVLHKGMRIGQLCFHELDERAERPYGSKSLHSHYQNQSGVTPAR